MKESSCRFLKEYANFKKEKLLELRDLNPARVDAAVDQVDKVLRMTLRGLLTVDEGMFNIARVDNGYMMEVWRNEQA